MLMFVSFSIPKDEVRLELIEREEEENGTELFEGIWIPVLTKFSGLTRNHYCLTLFMRRKGKGMMAVEPRKD